ncbi:hypothetical protein K432DRAFT_435292 [Lepidopterella palustris CBS 459.81]|uniref:Uncharacterized protein n=1 Tax=Lepidopterella palustris CBS 459.81 TaxID=1314670 RepID=A0A8E2JEL6_9PEZI|nr:hypothetical protein K432DRAFT_435292 [Lepidopterella palustris CBS 459.81]
MFPPTTTTIPYRLAGLAGLILGHRLIPSLGPYQSMEPHHITRQSLNEHHPPPGVYTARELVSGALPLLESVVLRLGRDVPNRVKAKDTLIDGLASSLAITGRESTLPLSYTASDTSRKEIAWQAHRIGKSLVRYVREIINADEGDPNLDIYSQCDGHLWTPGTASLLLGPRSNGDLMQLYNEWLHRMVLLRDALLPFENYEEVPLLIAPSNSRGLRDFEEPRKVFLLECLTGIISQSAIVNVAKAFTGASLPQGGYGLQYSQGLILPAFLSGSPSLHLLRYHPVRLDDSQTDLLFDYEHPVYYRAPRNEISQPEHRIPPGAWPPPSLMSLNPQVTKSSIGVNIGSDSSRRILQLQLDIDTGISVSVDLGQIARGRRYAYRASSKKSQDADASAAPPPETSSNCASPGSKEAPLPSPPLEACDNPKKGFASALLHATARTLAQPGLVTSTKKKGDNQVHVFPAKDPLVGLALLGKLYPENVILLDEDEEPESAEKTGKGFGARFVVLQAASSQRVNGIHGT